MRDALTPRLRARASLGLALLSLAVPLRAQEKPPEFPSAVDLVTVDVVVKDKKGNPVTGLSPEDFTLLEDGRPQKVVSFDQVSGHVATDPLGARESEEAPAAGKAAGATPARLTVPPRTFVVVFDQVHLTALQADRSRRALGTFLKSSLRDGDRIRLVAVGGWEFEGPADEALDEVRRFEGQRVIDRDAEALTDYEAMRIDRYDDRPLILRVIERWAILSSGRRPSDREGERINTIPSEDLGFRYDEGSVKILAKGVYAEAVRRNLDTLGCLEVVLGKLAAVRGRKSLILVSPGLIQDAYLDGFKRVVDAASRANTAIYFIDARGLEVMPAGSAEHSTQLPSIDVGYAMTSESLESQGSEILAADTGGFSVKNRNNLASGFRQIAEETRSYYLLAYNPAPARTEGEFRKIQVKLRRGGLEVRARKGYYASLPGSARVAQAAPDAAISLRAAAYAFGDAGQGMVRTLLVADADVGALDLESQDGLLRGSFDLVIVVTSAQGGEADRLAQQVDVSLTPERRQALHTRGLPLARAVELAPGWYEARVALSDRRSGRAGAVSHRFEVPAAGFRVSTPILSDVMEPGADAARNSPVIGARRAFRQRGTLYFQYEVYGAKPDPATGEPAVTSGWTIRDRNGAEWAAAEPSRLHNTGSVVGGLEKVDLTFPPGEYTLVLDARDQLGARTTEVREPFTVEAAARP